MSTQMLCPECMGELTTTDGQSARCTIHGGSYRILFSRLVTLEAAPPPIPKSPPIPDAGPRIRIPSEPEPPQPLSTRCPTCGRRFRIQAEHVGREATCKQCQTRYAVVAEQTESGSAAADGNGAHAAAAEPEPAARCKRHPAKAAGQTCAACRAPMCETCAFPQEGGGALCPDCALAGGAAASGRAGGNGARRVVAPATPMMRDPRILDGDTCHWHPAVQAMHLCRTCGRRVCSTCDFVFPGNVHICPECATSRKQPRLSPARRNMAIGALALAACASLSLVIFLVLSAVEQGNKEAETAAGLFFAVFVFIPILVGFGLGLGSLDKNLGNPLLVKIAAAWNIGLAAMLLLLVVIGLLAR